MHNTARHRTQAQVFNVAEAALDAGQAAAWVNWPIVDTPTPTLPGDFEAKFPASQFPRPSSGQFVTVHFYDDDGTGDPSPAMHPNAHGDVNGQQPPVDRGGGEQRRAQGQGHGAGREDHVHADDQGGGRAVHGLGRRLQGHRQPARPRGRPARRPSAVGATSGAPSTRTGSRTSGHHHEPGHDHDDVRGLPRRDPPGADREVEGRREVLRERRRHAGGVWATDPRVIVVENGNVDLKDIPNTETDANGADSIWSADSPGHPDRPERQRRLQRAEEEALRHRLHPRAACC